MTKEEFRTGWAKFLNNIFFNHSNLDADSIAFMIKMPGDVYAALPETEGEDSDGELNP